MNAMLKNAEVKEISIQQARPFIEQWHYSGCVPTGKNIFFGWMSEGIDEGEAYNGTLFNEPMYAVADYGIGVNPYQASFLSRETGHSVVNGNLLELKRLCRIEPKTDTLPLTAFLSRCHKLLKKRGYSYIVSFSDPMHGHDGGIYRAANFMHLGVTNPEYHTIDNEGNIRHRRYAFRYARRKGIVLEQARIDLGLKRIKTAPKDRWFLAL